MIFTCLTTWCGVIPFGTSECSFQWTDPADPIFCHLFAAFTNSIWTSCYWCPTLQTVFLQNMIYINSNTYSCKIVTHRHASTPESYFVGCFFIQVSVVTWWYSSRCCSLLADLPVWEKEATKFPMVSRRQCLGTRSASIASGKTSGWSLRVRPMTSHSGARSILVAPGWSAHYAGQDATVGNGACTVLYHMYVTCCKLCPAVWSALLG